VTILGATPFGRTPFGRRKGRAVKPICITLGPRAGGKGFRPERTIIIAKALRYDDYQVAYGGAAVGLLGVLARAALESKGRIAPRIPGRIKTRLVRKSPAGLIIVGGPGERSRVVLEFSETLISVPGGYGTVREACALLAGAQPDRRRRPIAFFTFTDYRRQLGLFLDRAGREGYLRDEDVCLLVFESSAEDVIRETRPAPLPDSTLA